MKHSFLSLSTAVFLLLGMSNSSCTSSNTSNDSSCTSSNTSNDYSCTSSNSTNNDSIVVKTAKPTIYYGLSFDFSQFYENPNYNIDLSEFSYEELRILRSMPYAHHGHWFKEGEICEKFQAIRKYRLDMMPVARAYAKEVIEKSESDYWKLWHTNYNKTYSLIELSEEEKAFVKRVDAKIAELEKVKNFAPEGLVINNPNLLINRSYIEDLSDELYEHLRNDNFAITDIQYDQMFNPYEKSDYDNLPNYITTDLYLHTYHMYFSWVLKRLETKHFLPAIESLCNNLYKQSLQEIAEAKSVKDKELATFAATYYAIGMHLCSNKQVENLPAELKDNYTTEIRNITALSDNPSEFLDVLPDNIFPYSLFKPRGHYTRSEKAKNYFKAMMWLQSAWFCMDDNKGLQRALFLALQYNNSDETTKKLCRSVYDPLEFLMGVPDNIPVVELAGILDTELRINSLEDLNDQQKLNYARNVILKKFEGFDRIKPKQEELMACKNKINFMPQRYTPDAEVLSLMYDEKTNSKRPYPCGLDVFDAFGSQSAANVLDSTDKGAKEWADYGKFRKQVRNRFCKFGDFNKTMYNKWIESLITLQKNQKDKPNYMKTSAWQRKDLNASLSSWAELKHDAILYAEQPLGAELGGVGDDFILLPSPVYIQHYVEPNLDFWKKLKEMIVLNISMLKKAGFYEENSTEYLSIADNSNWLLNKIDLCIRVTEKELKDVRLTNEENDELGITGGDFENFTLRVLHPEIFYTDWFEVKGPDTCIAQIADVFTRNVPNCDKNGVLHVAVAKANEIYVVVKRNGLTYLTRGAVFDYHEFVDHNMERHTDEDWQKMILKKDVPGRPSWVKSLYTKDVVNVNKKTGWRDAIFWSENWEYDEDSDNNNYLEYVVRE